MENCQSSEQAPKNAQSPSRPVHLGMMAGDHFPRKNVLLSTQGEIKKLRFLRKIINNDFVFNRNFIQPFYLCKRLTAGVTGGWGDQGSETENCHSSETTPKNAQSPSRPVHLGMMMDHHFPPKNVHLSKEDIPKGAVFEEIDAFLPIPG